MEEFLGVRRRLAAILAAFDAAPCSYPVSLAYPASAEGMSAILLRLGARTRVEAITRLRGRRLVLPSMGEL